jgi:hypothetical protein
VPTPPPVLPLPARGPDFNQTFWNEFVYNGFESPAALQPLQRLMAAPMLYLKTVDEAGNAIDAFTLDTVQEAMMGVAPKWGGGQFGLAGVERGTGTKAGAAGWLTVRWFSTNVGNICARSNVGVDGGVIEMNYLVGGSCSCNGAKIRPRTARHELGHAFGYYHTDNPLDVMYGGALGCDATPSAREQYHATLAYQSPVGSTGALPSHAPPMVIVD